MRNRVSDIRSWKDIVPKPIKPGDVHPELSGQIDAQRKSTMHGVIKKRPTGGERERENDIWVMAVHTKTKRQVKVLGFVTHLERNCTTSHIATYIPPLMSQESMSRSAMNPTNQITRNGVPNITFCLNSCQHTNTTHSSMVMWWISERVSSEWVRLIHSTLSILSRFRYDGLS